MPFDPEQTIYVWFDALLNYITAIGYGEDEARFRSHWPADVHVIGKDITRFHCALWPAMLMSAGLPLPKQVFAHGFVYNKGAKISKSAGTAIDPMDVFRVHGADAFRYYFMRECPFGGDGNFSDERFAEVYNADLANNLGNLYSRTLSMCVKYFNGRLDGSSAVDPDRLACRPRPRGAGVRPPRARRDVPVQPRAATHLAGGARRRQPLRPGDRALQAGQDRPRGLQGRPDQPGGGASAWSPS